MHVRIALRLSCGCTEALLDDGGRLVVCMVNACRPAWWCECVEGLVNPDVCDHVAVLFAELGVS
jgi:hypothetical protein